MTEFNIGDEVRAEDSIDTETGIITDKKSIVCGFRYTVNGKVFNDGGEGYVNAKIELICEKRRFKIGDLVTVRRGLGAPSGNAEVVEFSGNMSYRVSYGNMTRYTHDDYLTERKFGHKFKVGDTVDVKKGGGAPNGTGEVTELRQFDHYKVYYNDYNWYVSGNNVSLHVERRFNIGDKVKFDTFVSGTGVVYKLDDVGYFIETSDVDGYEKVYSSESSVTKIEPSKLEAGDKLEFGKWKFEVTDDELTITNMYPDDVIVLDETSNGWIKNSKSEVLQNW